MKNFSIKNAIARRLALALAAILAGVCAADAAVATWDANTELDVAGYRLSYGTQPGLHTTSINVGKVTSYQFFPPAGARYYVVVQAYNTKGVLSAKSAEVTIDVPLANRAPLLSQPANQTSILNSSVSLQLTASDPDGNLLSFSATGLPPGVSINNRSGILAGLALAKGTFTVTVRATDGSLSASRTFTWTVSDPLSVTVNLAPLDTTLTANHVNNSTGPSLLAYTYPAYRALSAILMKFNLSQIPANATIQSAALSLFLTGVDGNTVDPNYTMSLHQLMTRNADVARATGWMANAYEAWTASQCCQNGFPLAQADISAARASTLVNRTSGLKTWDATALVRAWLLLPSTNYGLLLNPDLRKGADRYRMFGSMQDPTTSRRPFLRVTYTAPSTTAPPTTSTFTTMAASTPEEAAYVRVDGDFDGDGRADLGTYRSATREWHVWTSSSNFAASIRAIWGMGDDVPVAADYDGDGITDVATYRPSTGDWHIWQSKARAPLDVRWGTAGDQPTALDV
ncbi:MAG TPA: DNRLRE domain-containing protein, partial [Vicinamibacterales bacterium]